MGNDTGCRSGVQLGFGRQLHLVIVLIFNEHYKNSTKLGTKVKFVWRPKKAICAEQSGNVCSSFVQISTILIKYIKASKDSVFTDKWPREFLL